MDLQKVSFDASDEDKDSSDDEFFPHDVVDSLRHKPPPNYTADELRFMNTYTYDKEPVKEWRQVTDFDAIKECNLLKWDEISKLLGKSHGFKNSLSLYKQNKSEDLVILIERIICENSCYYFPAKCFMSHKSDLKNLFRKSVHDKLNPHFKNIFENYEAKDATLELTEYGAPKLLKLAEDIGFNTELQYDGEFLNIDYSVLKEDFWMDKRPCFVKEEKKVLDIIHGLLLSAAIKREADIAHAVLSYSQTNCGLNDPILKLMCHGPDYGVHEDEGNKMSCDIKQDEENLQYNGLTFVEHSDCKTFKKRDHWEYKHHEDESECMENQNIALDGPVTNKKSEVYYPCNLRHCWVHCKCMFCYLNRTRHCKQHKMHIKNNTKECSIQQEAQCQQHWIDHPDNFQEGDDIEIAKSLLYHNGELKTDGRNYRIGSSRYSGLKKVCKTCRKNTLDHLLNHLTPHLQCKHCQYELKTAVDQSYWKKSCNICGKNFTSEHLKVRHVRRHDMPRQQCDICKITCLSKSNLRRHMIEQHDGMFQAHNRYEGFECVTCKKHFLTKGKLRRHVQGVHHRSSTFQEGNIGNEFGCNICEKTFTRETTLKEHNRQKHKSHNQIEGSTQKCEYCGKHFATVSNLKRHLNTHAGREDKLEESKKSCEFCGKEFATAFNLKRHLNIHSDDKEPMEQKCKYCGKSFTTISNLKRHLHIHTGNTAQFQCLRCEKNYTTKKRLDTHVQSIHENMKYSCSLCDKTYSRNDQLRAHVNNYHK